MCKKNEKFRILLVWLCILSYFVSYITRINYTSVLLEIEKVPGFGKVAAALALTGSSITYGAGQLVSGWLGDRIRPRLLVFLGLMLSGAMNLAVPLFTYPGPVLFFWCVNGFAQALIWPPLVRLMVTYLNEEQYKKSCVQVTCGSSVGTIAVYLLAPLCISHGSFRSLFFLCAFTAILFAAVWLIGVGSLEKRLIRLKEVSVDGGQNSRAAGDLNENRAAGRNAADGQTGAGNHNEADSPKAGRGARPRKTLLLVAMIMTTIVMQGILRDGITAWTPSYLSDTFRLGSAVSVLSGIVLPIFGICCLQLTSWLNRKLIKNELLCAGSLFLPSCLGSLLLFRMFSANAVLSVFLLAVITGCMYGVNVILTSMLPPYFGKNGKVSFISGLFNSCTYLGSALSGSGSALIAQSAGWSAVILFWCGAALVGTVLCFKGAGSWKRFRGIS